MPAVHADNVIDTMGAGDSYFSAFLCSLLETSKTGKLIEGTQEEMGERLRIAMEKGALICSKSVRDGRGFWIWSANSGEKQKFEGRRSYETRCI